VARVEGKVSAGSVQHEFGTGLDSDAELEWGKVALEAVGVMVEGQDSSESE